MAGTLAPTTDPNVTLEEGDVNIYYNNELIGSMSEDGTAVLKTKDTICEDDIEVEYTKPSSGSPEYYTATLDDSDFMMNGVKYNLPTEADVSKIYAVGDGATRGSNTMTCVAIASDYTKLYAVCWTGTTASPLEFAYDSAENAYIAWSEPYNLPSTIKLYHT